MVIRDFVCKEFASYSAATTVQFPGYLSTIYTKFLHDLSITFTVKFQTILGSAAKAYVKNGNFI